MLHSTTAGHLPQSTLELCHAETTTSVSQLQANHQTTLVEPNNDIISSWPVIAICKIEFVGGDHLEIEVPSLNSGTNAIDCHEVFQEPLTGIVPVLM
jgi:hypothetical protein